MIEEYQLEMITRLLGALIFGFAIGYFRRGGPAGIRTFTLICLGAALFTITALNSIFTEDIDPSRIISGIVTGIGFIGAGVIWKHDGKLDGLTTAATIWMTAAIGINIGLGEWAIAIITTVLTIIILVLKPVTEKLPKLKKKKD